ALSGSAFAEPISLKRGVDLGLWIKWHSVREMLEDPSRLDPYPDWQREVTPRMLEVLVEQGFDFARMPTDPAPMLAFGPGEQQDKLIAGIVAATQTATDAGLKVVVDFHPIWRGDETGGFEDVPEDLWPEFVVLVGRVAAALSRFSADEVAIELLNEPIIDCEAVYGGAEARWPAMLAEAHAIARANAPDLTIVLTGACWGQANALATLDPDDINDDNVLWTFHSYDPYLFTHQGASWTSSPEKYVWDLPYPPSSLTDARAAELASEAKARMAAAEGQADADAIDEKIAEYLALPDSIVTANIERAAAWADEHGLPRDRILLGEFGGLHTVDGKSLPRDWYLHFIADKRKAAEAAGMSWAVLSYVGGMGVADAEAPDRRLEADICRALGLPCGN
ncbi:MAG: glycoside hydrolase family 5 protein, partial [Tabrizicola sp.]|nr:glycoside hydrolase family 5 protein [Tabrizicola sp.]